MKVRPVYCRCYIIIQSLKTGNIDMCGKWMDIEGIMLSEIS